MSAYAAYDAAMTDNSQLILTPAVPDSTASGALTQKANQALGDVQVSASVRISSFIRNDGDLMSTEQQIADISGKEMAALHAYQKAAAEQSADLEQRKQALGGLTSQRQSAYSHFLELAGLR